MPRPYHLVLILMLSLLAACGGGGDDPEQEDARRVPTPGPVRCDLNPTICR
jgi:hypothetical protein